MSNVFTISSDAYDSQCVNSMDVIEQVKIIYPIVELTSCSFKNYLSLKTIELPPSLKAIRDFAFNNCYSLSNIKPDSQLTYIGNNSFENCKKLNEFDISQSQISSIEYMCFTNSGISHIELPYATIIKDSAFANCKNLTAVTFSNSIKEIGPESFIYSNLTYLCLSSTNQLKIGAAAFKRNNIKEAYIGTNVVYIGKSAFENCKQLQSLSIEYSNDLSIDNDAFYSCSNLQEVHFICHNRAKLFIEDRVFHRCYNLSSINFPDNTIHIGELCFQHCYSLTTIKLPNTIQTLGNAAFLNCIQLSSVNIPKKIQNLGGALFENDKMLTNLDIPKNLPQISSIMIISEI